MNILMIHPHDIYSHAEPWTVRITYLAQEFVKRGHQVKLIYHPLDRETPLEELAKQQRYSFETIPFLRSHRSLLKTSYEFTKQARWANVIHFQKCFSYVSLPSLTASSFFNKPVHYDWDDWEYEIYNFDPVNKLVGYSMDVFERMLPSMVDTLSVASEALKDLAIERGFPKEFIFNAPVGADPLKFNPGVSGDRVREKHDIDRKLVLYLGQLHGAQYADLFIQAAAQILKQRDDVLFMLVGTGERFGMLHYQAEKLGIAHKIVFTGGIDHKMVPQYIAAADVAVACFEDTKQTRCKSPLKVCEYLAMGKAIVASEMGEVGRMLDGGKAGLLVKPGCSESLAGGINRLLDNDELRKELGRNARLRSEQVYNWSNTAANLLTAYQAGIDKHKPVFKLNALDNVLNLRPAKVKDFIHRNRDIMGTLHGAATFVGPRMVQIDPTFTCNADCIGCWCRSPLLHDKMQPLKEQRIALPWDVMDRLVDDLADMGTTEIYLAGGGEPFMYPHIMKLLRKIKEKNMVCFINTNFTLVNEKKLDEIIELGIDHITLSMWAGTPEVYSLTHPNKTEETFHYLYNMARYLNRNKKMRKPLIKVYHVISNLNYYDVENMVQFAIDTGCESVEFTVTDIIPGRTEFLLLSEDQQKECYERCLKIQDNMSKYPEGFMIFRFDQFMRRLNSKEALTGDYDANIIDKIPCTIGWTFARVNSDGDVNGCLKSHRIPIGNLHKNTFREIWTSPKMHEFRQCTNVYKKRGDFFRMIGNDPAAPVGCHKSCDDLARNITVHQRTEDLGLLKRQFLHLASRYAVGVGKAL